MIAQAMKERVMTPKPGWVIRAHFGEGTFLGSLPAGMAATADEAIAKYGQLRGVRLGRDVRAWPKSESRR